MNNEKVKWSIYITLMVMLCGAANAEYNTVAKAEYTSTTVDYPELIPPPQYEFIVNRSTYTMDIKRDGEVIDTHRVIVGRPGWTTPLIETQFSNIEINPIWDVPKSIAKSMVRKFKNKKDPIGYINRNGYYFVDSNGNEIPPKDIDWKALPDSGPYDFKIKQKPGHLNVLGPVMFVLQGSKGVQMHGTSSPHLFERKKRRFSHGCIRIDGAAQLAALLLDKSKKEFEQYRSKIGNKWIRLPNPVKVKVVE